MKIVIAAALYLPPVLFAFDVITAPYLIITIIAVYAQGVFLHSNLINIIRIGILIKVLIAFGIAYGIAYISGFRD